MLTPQSPSSLDRCVVDASVLIKMVLLEPDSPQAHALFANSRLDARNIPDLAFVECGSILVTAHKRGRLPEAEVRAGLADLLALGVTVHATTTLIAHALHLALTHGISAYDAIYLSLADALGVPLVTADAVLARAIGDPLRVRLLAEYATPEP